MLFPMVANPGDHPRLGYNQMSKIEIVLLGLVSTLLFHTFPYVTDTGLGLLWSAAFGAIVGRQGGVLWHYRSK